MMIKVYVLAMGVLLSSCGYSKKQQATVVKEKADNKAQGLLYVAQDGSRQFVLTRIGDDEVLLKEQASGTDYTMRRVKTASGERYTADDGHSIWIKGNSFMFLKGEDIILKGERVDQESGTVTFQKTLDEHGIKFHLVATKAAYSHTLELRTQGLQAREYDETFDIMGFSVVDALLADLNNDKSPELLVITQSDGSGSYGELLAFSVNNLRSMSQVYVVPIGDTPAAEGYMGHDEFMVENNVLKRRFPIYRPEDTNAKATGGTRQLTYRLEEGEAMRKLSIIGIEDL